MIDFEHVNIVTVQGDRRSYATVRTEWDFKNVCIVLKCLACGVMVLDRELHEKFHKDNDKK